MGSYMCILKLDICFPDRAWCACRVQYELFAVAGDEVVTTSAFGAAWLYPSVITPRSMATGAPSWPQLPGQSVQFETTLGFPYINRPASSNYS